MHIVSLIVCYAAIVTAFVLLIRLASRTETRTWMRLRQDSKQSKTEPLHIGVTNRTIPGGYVTEFNPPIPFGKPYHLEGD